MLLVYTHKITPRVSYIFKQFFIRILNIPVSFTTEVAEFVAHNGPKITYAKNALGNEFFVHSNDLLFDQGINDVEVKMIQWDEVPCFFEAPESSSIPFDIFAASFYLIARYEEYLPHIQDVHERFEANESIAYKNGFLEQPLVDVWARKFLRLLKEKFPKYQVIDKEFNMVTLVDVNMAYQYKQKGIVRSIGGYISELFSLKLVNFWNRLLTNLNFRKDPYDTFDYILAMKKKYNLSTLFFFLIGDFTTYDKNISASNSTYQSLIKSVADYARVGLHPSYFSHKNSDKLKREKLRMEGIINTPVEMSRQHYLRLSIPETYQHLLDLDIKEDYTMGYEKAVGFRAGTCTPFYFYDLDYEIQTPLKVFPFAFSDGTLKNELELSNEESLKIMLGLKSVVKTVNGTLIGMFHNVSFSENDQWKGWRSIYESVMTKV